MPRRKWNRAKLETTLMRLRAGVRNTLTLLPGERPEWVVVELAGSFPARTHRPNWMEIPRELFQMRETTLEDLFELCESLASSRWLKGVVFHVDGLHVGPATAFSIRRAIEGLAKRGKETVSYITNLTWMSYYVASAAREVVAPESAEVRLYGLGVTITFMKEALERFGVRFEKLAIDEYKNAFDTLVRQDMSPAQREQYAALLQSFEQHWIDTVAADRGKQSDQVRALVDEGVSTADRAHETGLVSRVLYEDELYGKRHRPVAEAIRFLRVRSAPAEARRIAVVSLLGAIMTGKSRRSPLPVPLIGGTTSGSDTMIRALRMAEADRSTAAIVLHVDSGGGSALASDLIWREVRRIRDKKPIVAVMGAVAASGGYYVLASANVVIAAPTSITGSIGVLTGKLVLQEFNARYGFNAERILRGRFSLMHHPAAPFTDEERDLLKRSNDEIYQRFVRRVAEGRKMTTDQVNDVGRGHVWSGLDAKRIGLVDELGDVETAIERARDIAGIHHTAAVWNVRAPGHLILPTQADPTTLGRSLEPFLRETHLLLLPDAIAWG